jgi:hypothetical protein
MSCWWSSAPAWPSVREWPLNGTNMSKVLGATCGRGRVSWSEALPAQLCSLGVDDLVDRELFDVRWPLHLHP